MMQMIVGKKCKPNFHLEITDMNITRLKKLQREYIQTLGIVEDKFEEVLTELYRTATRLDQEIFKEQQKTKQQKTKKKK
jgi:hypothetical protein